MEDGREALLEKLSLHPLLDHLRGLGRLGLSILCGGEGGRKFAVSLRDLGSPETGRRVIATCATARGDACGYTLGHSPLAMFT